MTGFNFFSHGSQDLYPVYLEDAKDLSNAAATRATIISNCEPVFPLPAIHRLLTYSRIGGAIAGGFFFGAVSQYLGRRLTIITAVIFAACFSEFDSDVQVCRGKRSDVAPLQSPCGSSLTTLAVLLLARSSFSSVSKALGVW